MGKVLLAYLGDDEVRRIVGEYDFGRPAGPNATASVADLLHRLAEIRERGYAIQDEEVATGLRSVSVPVMGRDGSPLAAINVAVSTTRHSVADLRGPLLTRALATAEEISFRVRAL